MNQTATILICIVISVCFMAAVFKALDPRFTFGGSRFRTPFWSSMFFVTLGALLIASLFV